MITPRRTLPAAPEQSRHPVRFTLIAPHIDDAAYALGGALLARRLPATTIITVYSVSSYAVPPFRKSPAAVTRLRRQEDDAFFSSAPPVHRHYLGRLDAPLRLNIPWPAVSTPRPPRRDETEVRTLARILQTHSARRTRDILLAPLGLGNHIDHLVVRRAVSRLVRCGIPGGFYEDLPYAATLSPGEIEQAVSRLATSCRTEFVPWVIVTPDRGAAKQRSLRAYRSQLGPRTISRITSHGRRLVRGGFAERIWLDPAAAALIAGRTASGRSPIPT